ncbi:MAG TPA: isoleucine--tRNA ligase, partial [Bacteroidia bacterium]
MKYPEYKGLDLSKTGKDILEYWEKNGVFEKSVSTREGAEPFVFYEGPPSANGMPGIHHVMARSIKDIFCRYQTLKGKQVKRKAGWDTHGLPIELSVEKTLGITKEDIGKKISVEEYNKACRKEVMKYTDKWEELTRIMGYWVDMSDPYITYTNDYIESVWWLLKDLYKKGLLYKGYTIQPYSPAAGTGLSSHELNQPGCYRDVKDTSVVAQFKVIKESGKGQFKELEGDVYFLAWTTTPWTLPANCALAVGEQIRYVAVKTFNPYSHRPVTVILAKDLLEKYFPSKNRDLKMEEYKSGDKAIPYTVLTELSGKELEGIKYEQLLSYVKPKGKAMEVIIGDFVTTEDGTGIVHTASVFGADDFRVAQQNGIVSITIKDENGNDMPLVDKRGKFVKEVNDPDWGFAGEYVKKEYLTGPEEKQELELQKEKLKKFIPHLNEYLSVDERIALKLKLEGRAFKIEKYEHSYPHCWRTDKPVLYYPLDSWFIKVSDPKVKDRMIALNKSINWKPEATGTGRFGNWLENANDWNLSRSRFWGIPLPIWRTEDAKEELCIGSVEELKNEIERSVKTGFMKNNPLAKFNPDDFSEENYASFDLHKPYADDIILVSASGKKMFRESDLIDVWFDSGAMPYAQLHYPFGPLTPEGGTYPKDENKWILRWQTANPLSYSLLKENAKRNRNNQTQAEEILWGLLSGKKLDGYKFRRQHVIGDVIVDFVCLSKKLVLEIDGEYHASNDQQNLDSIRTQFLTEAGYKVIRFTNEEVISDTENVLEKITAELAHRPIIPKDGTLNPPFGGRGLFPADFIAEGVDQTRGWFYTLHAIATMCFDSVAYKNVVSNGLVLDKNGNKMSKRLGNAVDPFATIEKYGPDATRWYMITNAQPWDNLKFDMEGIAEVQRKFFGTLYNTYSFFAIYANIDGFTYKEAEVPLNERPEIDRWILSELNSLIKNVDAAYAEYEPTKAGRAIEFFLDEHLSNWYVRLCRRRFWKGEYSKDKIAAFQTLYRCMEVIAQLSSPIAPFYMDRLFNDLNQVTHRHKVESVHLSDFPKCEEKAIDKSLEERMELAQKISSMILSIRKKEQIRVRQPLNKVRIPVLDESFKNRIEAVKELILSEVNVKEVEFVDGSQAQIVKNLKLNFKTLGK